MPWRQVTRETEKGMSGFSFKVFSLAYVTSFDEVRPPAIPCHATQPALPCHIDSDGHFYCVLCRMPVALNAHTLRDVVSRLRA